MRIVDARLRIWHAFLFVNKPPELDPLKIQELHNFSIFSSIFHDRFGKKNGSNARRADRGILSWLVHSNDRTKGRII
jgi:hypothetical protein